MNLACKSALLHRGVSHLIFPDEVQTLPSAAENAPSGKPDGRITPLTIAPPQESVDAAVPTSSEIQTPGHYRGSWSTIYHAENFGTGRISQRASTHNL